MKQSRAPEARDFNGKVMLEFRASGGEVGGLFQGADVLLLHHTGASSGEERVSPLAFLWAGDCLAAFAEYAVEAAPRGIPAVVLNPAK
jgi:hypothetical protein